MTEKTFIFHPYDMTSNDLSRPIMTSKLPEFNLSLCTYQIKAVNPNNTNMVREFSIWLHNDLLWPLMTSKFKYFNYNFMHIKWKLQTPTIQKWQRRPLFFILMTSYDLSRPINIMTSKLPEFNLSLCTYQIKAVNPNNTKIVRQTSIWPLMTSMISKLKYFNYNFMPIK